MSEWLQALYRRLPLVRELQAGLNTVAHDEFRCMTRVLQEVYLSDLLRQERYADKRHLAHFEFKVFSQFGEDGVIAEILRRIELPDRFFVEIGVGDGLENNTGFLLAQGWRGVWVEGDGQATAAIRSNMGDLLNSRLSLVELFVTRENIGAALAGANVPRDFGLLSIDIDQNTYWVWEGLRHLRPRVVVVEYNARWPADVDWKVTYEADRVWNSTFAFGASLKALERLGAEMGYSLVGTNLAGANAFFVRSDLIHDQFVGPFDAQTHYEPPRYYLLASDGHAPGYRCYSGEARS